MQTVLPTEIKTVNQAKTTVVRNLMTNEVLTFVNSYSLTYNLVTVIMMERKQSQIWDQELRAKILLEISVTEKVSTITGNLFACCGAKDLHLHAKFIN